MSKYKPASTVGYNVIKKGTETYTSEYDDDSSSFSSTNQEGGAYRYESIVNTNYKKPKNGTVQDNMTKSDIKKKIVGYKSLKTQDAKKYLLTLTPFKTWIKYYNPITKQFRTGGLLMKVDPELKYIMLVNTSNKITWSVQLKENIIFVPDPVNKEKEERERMEQEKKVQKEEATKGKLYQLYLQGKLKKIG